MKRIISYTVLLVIILLGIIFAVLNAQPVQFDFYFGRTEQPLSLIIIVTLILGSLLGILASFGLIVRSRREAARLRRTAELAEKEVANLRAIPIKDRH